MSEEGALLPAVIDTAVVRPGETLVLVAPDATREWIDQVKDECERYLPDVKIAIIDGVTQALVYRPDEPPRSLECIGGDHQGTVDGAEVGCSGCVCSCHGKAA